MESKRHFSCSLYLWKRRRELAFKFTLSMQIKKVEFLKKFYFDSEKISKLSKDLGQKINKNIYHP